MSLAPKPISAYGKPQADFKLSIQGWEATMTLLLLSKSPRGKMNQWLQHSAAPLWGKQPCPRSDLNAEFSTRAQLQIPLCLPESKSVLLWALEKSGFPNFPFSCR